MASKMVQKVSGNRYFWRQFSKVDLLIHFGRPLSHFGCPLAHLWFPFGSPWLSFVSFGFLLAYFWCPLGYFWRPWDHFCSPLRSIFTFLRSPGVIFNSFWIFHENTVQNLILKSFSLKITFSVNQIVFSRRAPNAPKQKVHLLLQPILQGHGAEHLPQAI